MTLVHVPELDGYAKGVSFVDGAREREIRAFLPETLREEALLATLFAAVLRRTVEMRDADGDLAVLDLAVNLGTWDDPEGCWYKAELSGRTVVEVGLRALAFEGAAAVQYAVFNGDDRLFTSEPLFASYHEKTEIELPASLQARLLEG